MEENNLKNIQLKEKMSKLVEKDIKTYDKKLLKKEDELFAMTVRTRYLLEKRKNLLIDMLDHSGQYISYVAQKDAEKVKEETLYILKKATEGTSYNIADPSSILKNIPEYVVDGRMWAENNPRGSIDLLVCATYLVSLLRDDNLIGNTVFAATNYKRIVQLLETVLNGFGMELLDILN